MIPTPNVPSSARKRIRAIAELSAALDHTQAAVAAGRTHPDESQYPGAYGWLAESVRATLADLLDAEHIAQIEAGTASIEAAS